MAVFLRTAHSRGLTEEFQGCLYFSSPTREAGRRAYRDPRLGNPFCEISDEYLTKLREVIVNDE